MPDNTFVLPAGLEIDMKDDTVSFKHDGDIVLQQSFGRQLGTVVAGGDLVLVLPIATGNLKAGGQLRISGDIDAGNLDGKEVHIGSGACTCRAISATEKIVIGAAKLKVDVIMAPDIDIDPDASGRVTVIESENERAPCKIKGGFSLAEYEELFGNSADFLAERGL